MKIEVPRKLIESAFSTVSGVIAAKSPKPILLNVKIVTDGDGLTLMATNQEIAIRRRITEGVKALSRGEALLPVAKTSSILRDAIGEYVDIETNATGAKIDCGRASYKLLSADPAEFPTVEDFTAQSFYRIKSELLRTMIRRTLFATDNESSRYALGGVLFNIEGDKLTMAATDTRRLAVVSGVLQIEGEPNHPGYPVIPSKALSLIERTLGDDEYALLSFTANSVLVRVGETTVFARLVEGRFPRYQDVVPKDSPIQIDVIAGAFHAAVRQAQIVTSEESRGVDFAFSKGLLRLSSMAAEVGQSAIDLPVAYDDKPLTITFDPRYVADFLKVLPPETEVIVELKDGESAGLFRTVDGYRYVVMPLSRD